MKKLKNTLKFLTSSFNKIVAYNSKQGTGLMEIIPKSELETTTFLPAVISNTDLGVIQADYVEGFLEYKSFERLQGRL